MSTSRDVVRLDSRVIQKVSMVTGGDDIAAQTADAKAATEREQNMTLGNTLRLYPKAVLFAFVFSSAIIMEGYDTWLMGSFYGFKPYVSSFIKLQVNLNHYESDTSSFRNRFGTQPDTSPGAAPGDRVVSAKWQTSLSASQQCGSILGLFINGWLADRYGYRKTMTGSLVVLSGLIFIPFFAKDIETFVVGAVLQGIPWGVFQTLTTTYAAEIAPVKLRAYLTTYVNLCWVAGQLIASGILKGLLTRNDEWSYRIPFAIQWVWLPFILIGVYFAPESPWWLVRQGRLRAAEESLRKLTSSGKGIPHFDAHAQVMMMKSTNELEIAIDGRTNYWDCFCGTDLRRTEIACMAWLAQAWNGAVLIGYAIQIYERAGLDDGTAFSFSVGQSGLGIFGTMLSWLLVQRAGRRACYLWGLGGMVVVLAIIGGLGFIDESNKPAGLAIGSMLIIYTFLFDLTIGPVCYAIVSEAPSTRLKIKTVVLARNTYNIGFIINNAITPPMLGVNAWNWGPKSGLFWAVACVLLWLWAYFRLPETKDRTYGEIDILFEQRVSARNFSKVKVDQFDQMNEMASKVDEVEHIKGDAPTSSPIVEKYS